MIAGRPLPDLALYEVRVVHQRRRPVAHRLARRIPMLLLDPERIAGRVGSPRLFSTRGPNLFGFSDRDHGDGRPGGLRAWTEARLRADGIGTVPASLRVLAMPRVLGRAFNPLALVFACGADDVPFAVLHQVSNTFGERHVYVLPVDGGSDPIRQECAKAMHVSPFLPMALDYRFRISIEPARMSVLVTVHDRDGVVLAASAAGERRAWTDRTLVAMFLRHGLLELKVLGAIHLEAWRLWRKGVAVFRHPGAVASRPLR